VADCRDWASTLRRASYRGVSFFVETDDVATGRRVVVHEYPHRDDPYIEDLGRKANTIQVSAYVTGNDVEGQEAALRAACGLPGPGQLSIPLGRFLVHCQDCSRNFNKDRLGYVAFSLGFVRDGTAAGPFPLGAFLRAVEFGLSELLAPLKAAVAISYSTVRMPAFVAEAGAARLREAAVMLEDGRRRTTTSGDAAPAWREAIVDLYGAAPTLAVAGSAGRVWTATSVSSGATEASTDDMVNAVWGAIALINEAAGADDAERLLRAMLEFGVDWVPPDLTTDARRREAANDETLGAMVRVAMLANWLNAMIARTYADRPAGKQALADVAEYIDNELMRLSVWQQYDVYSQIAELRKKSIAYFQRLITDLAPVLTFETSARMPSLYWACRLYNDAGRAAELAGRNQAIHPSFLPESFEALAK
jgi:hypothetical protein